MKYAGIYIHIPFCAVKCMYCDFYSITDREDAIPQFVEAMCSAADDPSEPVRVIFTLRDDFLGRLASEFFRIY